MKVSKILTILAISLFFASTLLVRIQFGSYSFFHIGIVIILALLMFFPEVGGLKSFLKIDTIVAYQLVFLLVVLVSYLVNIPNADSVSKIYSSNSGESPSFLYWKIMLNGLIFVLSTIVAYLLGRTICSSKANFLKVYNAVIIFCLINAFVNVVAWLIATGGVIGRYNFEPPITFSPGMSIQYSSIGFLLGLGALAAVNLQYRRKMVIVALAILLFSILIILTRQSQVSFLIMWMWYFYKTKKMPVKTLLWVVPLAIIVMLGGITILYLAGALDSYGGIDSTESTDVAIRLLMLNSAYELFINQPLFGIGYGMFVGHNTVPIVITGVPTYLASPHNGVASILCELGMAGIVMIFLITTIVIRKMNESLKKIKDVVLYKYCCGIYVVQVIFMLSVFVSNSNLYGPPSEVPYLYISFISWFMIGSVIGIKNAKL
ncbi:O-Antigen ligase [compost metagenome]